MAIDLARCGRVSVLPRPLTPSSPRMIMVQPGRVLCNRRLPDSARTATSVVDRRRERVMIVLAQGVKAE